MEPETNAYRNLHKKIVRQRGSASQYICWGLCGRQADEWANVHGTDKFIPLCRWCHRQYDLRGKQDTCPQGHDTKKYGRTRPDGGCRVCRRIRTAGYKDRIVCDICGYSFDGKCDHV